MKLLIEIYADGYDTPEQHSDACKAIIEDWLDSSGVTAKVIGDGDELLRERDEARKCAETYRDRCIVRDDDELRLPWEVEE